MNFFQKLFSLFYKTEASATKLLDSFLTIKDEGNIVIKDIQKQLKTFETNLLETLTNRNIYQEDLEHGISNLLLIEKAIKKAVEINTQESLNDAKQLILKKNSIESINNQYQKSIIQLNNIIDKLNVQVNYLKSNKVAIETEIQSLQIEYDTAKLNIKLNGPSSLNSYKVNLDAIRTKVKNARCLDTAVVEFNNTHQAEETLVSKYEENKLLSVDSQLDQYKERYIKK